MDRMIDGESRGGVRFGREALPWMASWIAVFGVAAGIAGAEVVANQMPSDQMDGSVSGDNTLLSTARVADDFTLPPSEFGWAITKLRGTLLCTLPADPSSAKFEMYLGSEFGLPASRTPFFTRRATGVEYLGQAYEQFDVLEFEVGDGSTTLFTVAGNTILWLSLVGRATGIEFSYFASYQYRGEVIGSKPAFYAPDLGFPEWISLDLADAGWPRTLAFSVEARALPGTGVFWPMIAGVVFASRRRRAVKGAA